jgi:hypothetical protein
MPIDPSASPVIRRRRETGERELVMTRWGIVPWFANSELEFKKLSTLNAKSDRLTDSKIWREPFAKAAALVPASGLPSVPVSVKALRCASTADAALCSPDRHLRSVCWLDMRSVRFSISHENRPSRTILPAAWQGQATQRGRQDRVLIAQVRE